MRAVPAVLPVTIPELKDTLAFALLLLHIPVAVSFVRVSVYPVHTAGVPRIGPGVEFTFILVDAPVTDVRLPQATGDAPVQLSTQLSGCVPDAVYVITPAGKLMVPPPAAMVCGPSVYTSAPFRYHVAVTVSAPTPLGVLQLVYVTVVTVFFEFWHTPDGLAPPYGAETLIG